MHAGGLVLQCSRSRWAEQLRMVSVRARNGSGGCYVGGLVKSRGGLASNPSICDASFGRMGESMLGKGGVDVQCTEIGVKVEGLLCVPKGKQIYE